MKNLKQKLAHLNWLHSVGIEYYCSEQKDRKNSLKNVLKDKNRSITLPKKIADCQEPARSGTVSTVIVNDSIEKKIEEREARDLATRARDLAELKEIVENFDGCELKKFATNTVFSDGKQEAKILLIGEAPGATEDEQGIPFCGESGKLLDNMLSTVGISRNKNAYITNTVFWRPPANRRPTQEEIDICRPFVERHIALINPKLIILVGNTAASSLLGKNEGISYIRQNSHSYINQYLTEPILTTAIFHPAYLLRQPMQKKATWFDLLKIKEVIERLGCL